MTTDVTCPCIIMRHGGLDGVALQKEEYFGLLQKLEIGMHVISGRQERAYTAEESRGRDFTIVERLDFHHPDSKVLFASQFMHGPETEGVERIDKEAWMALFERHRRGIFESIDALLRSIPNNTPVLIYNLVSLRHAQPAAAVALRDLVRKYPERGFLSHSADPDAERPEKIERIYDWALEVISANEPGEPYNGGPYREPNLSHIVLNPTQRANFVLKYDVPSGQVYEIPDFLEFPGPEPQIAAAPEDGFLEALGTKAVVPDGDGCRYETVELDEDQVFFLSPVRPVYRKRLIEAMMSAHAYATSRKERVAFVVTHPNLDDPTYFLETVRFAAGLGLTYLHLDEPTIERLETVYANLAPLRTIGIVASSAGGWENALNEMARWCIPFAMAARLNSYPPLTRQMDVKTFGMRFSFLTALSRLKPASAIRDLDLTIAPHVTPLLKWIDAALEPSSRKELVEHNYRHAYRHLSLRPTAIRLFEAVNDIYVRLGDPRARTA